VRPGAATLEPQGSEPPAVVNLLTTDWDLGHEAIPATLVDLAARRHVEFDLEGDRTFVRVRPTRTPRSDDVLTRYDEMVLGHVRGLARQTDDGRVPAEALTTGPDETARGWWKNFRGAVVEEARSRGLSRPRWSATLKAILIVAAVPVGLAVSLAFSTIPDDPDDEYDAGDKASGVVLMGLFAFGGLCGVAVSRSGERDTTLGREAAAHWLGLRELLAEDPLFAEQPPAAVAIWDHLLAHGTALGAAHGVVKALPLGAESEREAWSSVGGRWRVVRVRYPRWLPPGYGLHPGVALLLGLLHLALAGPLLGLVLSPQTLLPGPGSESGGTGWGDRFSDLTADLDTAARLALLGTTLLLAVVVGGAALRGAWMVLAGLVDLVTGREVVEGRVLRKRVRTSDDKVRTHLAVDDGSTDRVRAWRFRDRVLGSPGQTVRADVTRWLRHVRGLEVVVPLPAGGTTQAATGDARAGARAPATTLGGARAGGDGIRVAATGTPAVPSYDAASTASTATPDPPPLPDDAAISAAAGWAFTREPGAPPHPAALRGGSAIYRSGGAAQGSGVGGGSGSGSGREGHVQVVWVPAATIEAFRRTPAGGRDAIAGLGDEAYRARFGGGVVVLAGDRVAMVTPHLPHLDPGARDDLAVRVAHEVVALAGGRGAPDRPGPGTTPAHADVGTDR
ncbi:MAG: DUF2207 domain-containing protein, partial [Acidimicrobiales bacterium]|nr:DUF2207 domain-containing protein [Acidimicrobiales bacterium]